ncbi:Flagellar biosynthetic protein FlhB [Planctomycetes bacterium Pan216]|uniref:Flagellar biosynthetic protein FlhB n=1 Tax=Kolteria novifilia TaxID=2527975 RepID=A0A518BCX3_9BACT|nr:Flagellar biosynthetic protein FlhB [Planctomycetes bacterium Pan216]
MSTVPPEDAERAPTRRKMAAALRYDQDHDAVPRMVARGQGELADRIIDAAREHGVDVYEDPDLVEILCQLDVNQMVPPKLFLAVAEVMAYVYRMNNRYDEVREMMAKDRSPGSNRKP